MFTLDLKGSTVDRRVLSRDEIHKIKNNNLTILNNVKNLVLKDEDFLNLGLSLNISRKDADIFEEIIRNDTEFLKNYIITDYSLLLNIHAYREEDYERNYKSNRIFKSCDLKYIYCVSIIDFLGVRI